jgi:serine protease Do
VQNLHPQVKDAVVRIETKSAFGSGFLSCDAGRCSVITNEHVVKKNGTVKVSPDPATGMHWTAKAQVLGKDHKKDVAVVEYDPKTMPGLKPLTPSDDIHIGQAVMIDGHPGGTRRQIVSPGKVTNVSRDFSVEEHKHKEWMHDTIQAEARIRGGNSGGPMVNTKAEAVGVAVASNGTNESFAVKMKYARDLMRKTVPLRLTPD